MKNQDFLTAIKVISETHTNEIIINKVEPNGQVQKVLDSPSIHIKNCCAGTIKRLVNAGFSLSMNDSLLTVNKY